ncbi:MAG: HPr family phosphocarrier protein [Chitinispirillaceae bacterium]|jgi:phosphotransferase system HPr (HPr) family protein
MVELQIKVTNTLGLHARPAAKIVQTANQYKSEILLITANAQADAKSILNTLMLAAIFNTPITIRASGIDEREAADSIATLFAQKFDEES